MYDMCTGILVRDMDAQSHVVAQSVVSPTSQVSPQLEQPPNAPMANAPNNSVDLRTKFHKYIKKEEEWLKSNLKEARYDLDSVDSVKFVLGSDRRIERV
jgi:hypothetical protein